MPILSAAEVARTVLAVVEANSGDSPLAGPPPVPAEAEAGALFAAARVDGGKSVDLADAGPVLNALGVRGAARTQMLGADLRDLAGAIARRYRICRSMGSWREVLALPLISVGVWPRSQRT